MGADELPFLHFFGLFIIFNIHCYYTIKVEKVPQLGEREVKRYRRDTYEHLNDCNGSLYIHRRRNVLKSGGARANLTIPDG